MMTKDNNQVKRNSIKIYTDSDESQLGERKKEKSAASLLKLDTTSASSAQTKLSFIENNNK